MMSSKQVKDYLSHHHLPQLLESLLTGLLYHHPEDPVSFLQSCLITIRQLGGPEAVTWDTFIHLERNQLSPGAPKTTPATPTATFIPSTTPPIPPITSSIPPKITFIPPIKPQSTPPIPRTPPTPQIMPPISQKSTSPLTTPQTAPQPKLLPIAPPGPAGSPPGPVGSPPGPTGRKPGPAGRTPGPAVTPPVLTERKERDSKTFSTDGPRPGLPPSPVRSQPSIDSDSDMTESSGLRQEVKILPLQRPRPLIIFIIGGPGSGKGSQAARLAHCFSLRVISLDELLRRQLLSHTSPSRKWKVISQMMGHGELGPQEETISELKRQVIGHQEVRGFIVDGFPRDIHQALSFQEQVDSPHLVMLLLCSNQTLSCRLQRRATRLGLLGDGTHDLQKRLDTFERDIVSISRYYRQLHLLIQVDADKDEEAVFADLSSVIKEKLLKASSDPADIPECSSAVPAVTSNTRSVNQ